MKLVFSIYDSAIKCFSDLVIAPSRGECQRELKSIVNSKQVDKNGQLHPYAADPASYTLFCIGEWNEENGDFNVYPTPEKVVCAFELKMKDVVTDKESV